MNQFRMILLAITMVLVGAAHASPDQHETPRRTQSSSPSWSSSYTSIETTINIDAIPTPQDDLIVDNCCSNDRANTIIMTGAATGILLLGGFIYYVVLDCISDPANYSASICAGFNSLKHASGHYYW